jgi:ComF family protein
MALIDVLLPPSCAGCGRYGSLLCDACRASFRSASPAAVTFMHPDPGVVVGESMTMALAAFRHEGRLRKVLERLKYSGGARLARPLAWAALPAFQRLLEISGPLPIVPVPIHPDRIRERGYNQAALLAIELARSAGLPICNVLVRGRATVKQHRLDRAARIRNLRGAFKMGLGARPPPAAIVVDDILTTSATLEACAIVLRDAGCLEVYGFALAREV